MLITEKKPDIMVGTGANSRPYKRHIELSKLAEFMHSIYHRIVEFTEKALAFSKRHSKTLFCIGRSYRLFSPKLRLFAYKKSNKAC